MRRTLAVIGLVCLVGAAAVLELDSVHAALITLGLLLATSVVAIAAATAVRRGPARIGPISRQLSVAVGIAVGATVIAVWVAAAVMFISDEDAQVLSVMAAVIAIVGVCVASVLTDPLVRDIERLRDRLREVGVGERSTDLVLASSNELTELAEAANAMIEQLAAEEEARVAADEARTRLIVAVSHDLRTPIASLRVLTEAIQDGIATGETRTRYLQEIQTHVGILSALIDDLFELARAQAASVKLKRAPIEIGELVCETVAAMHASGEERGITLSAEPRAGHAAGSALIAEADAEQVRRVLMNLLDNSLRHTPRGGTVSACTRRVGTNIEVEVADNGTGIGAADRDHVFEAFFRGVEHASRSDGGAGLGLAIARAIVEGHGGELWLAPADVGTRLCFSLPALGAYNTPPDERELSLPSTNRLPQKVQP